MSDDYKYDRCGTCGKWDFVRSHRCPPRFEIYCPEDGDQPDDAREYFGSDEEDAAEAWAKRYDSSGDYTLAGGDTRTIMVRACDSENRAWTKMTVTGEYVAEYHANKEPS